MIKSLYWLGNSRDIVRSFIKSVRAQVGYQLYRLQHGLMPTDYKPMSIIRKGVFEIRSHHPEEHRVIYIAKLEERIYILHAFKKKTQKTSQKDINIAQKNYRALMQRIRNFKIGK